MKPVEPLAVRQPHAVLDLPSRLAKGEKIARLLGICTPAHPVRVLEIGTGSGGIAHWFGTHSSGMFEVDAVDVIDNRKIFDGYRYHHVDGTTLPFPDGTFDVVISNHVIEHVGAPEQQRAHLAELRRVMAPSARGYLAVPSRWMLVEPHFQLAFLSWLPEALRSPYVRLRGKGNEYDCRPLTRAQADGLLDQAGFLHVQHCGDALRLTFELEDPDRPLYRLLLSRIPDTLYARMAGLFPTLIYTFSVR